MTRYDRATLQRLSFRRQFVLGPHFADEFSSWQRIIIDGGLRLTAHPDLDVCRVANRDKAITLLGYILDPARPSASNLDIVTELLDRLHTGDDFFEHTARFGGRWVLVVNDGVRTIGFADAAGLRQVAYTAGSAPGQLWCASQPGLLAEVVDLPLDSEAVAFLQTGRLVWPPGDATPYGGIKALLPNHYLDLRTGRPCRYWPNADLPAMPLREAIRKSSEILRGLMEGVQHRSDLMLALTAGWDSRLTLAASRSMTREIFHFTAVFSDTAVGDPDVTVPARLLLKLGRKHEILDCRNDVDDEFAKIYRRNVIMAHEEYCPVAQALLDQTPSEGVCIRGDVAEIAKCYYRLGASNGEEVTAHELCVVVGLPRHPFLMKEFERWLSGARGRSYNVPLLDLFYWEQEASRLHAMIEAECDIARESFAPLNCRSLLTTMLSVPERYRQEPTFDLFRALIKRLWPEALMEPINDRPQIGPEVVIRRTLASLGLLELVPRAIKRTAKKLISQARRS
jgi:hypothetical protein